MVEVLRRRTQFEGKFLRFVTLTYTDSSGSEREWESFERVNCEGIVAIVPVTDEHEVLLIRQFRPPLNRCVIEFPAGLNDKGETLESAARRELQEETGYTSRNLIPLGEGPLSSGASGEVLTAYLATGIEFTGFGKRDETEDIEVIKVPMDDLIERLSLMRSQGNLVDMKILGLVALAKQYL